MSQLIELVKASPKHVGDSALAWWTAVRARSSPVADGATSRAAYLEAFEGNRQLCNLEYRTRSDAVTSLPFRWYVSIAERCNLRCVMCRASEDPGVFTNTLPEHVYENIDILLPFVDTFHIFGAEPFFAFDRGRIRPLVSRAEEYVNIKFSGTTNGLLMDREKAAFCLEHFADIRISIDSPEPEVYESIRINGRFDVLLRNVEYLRDLKARRGRAVDEAPVMHVNYLVMDRTYRDIVRFVDLAHDLGIHEVRFSPVRVNFDPAMAAEDIFTDLDKTEEFSNLLVEAERRAEAYGLQVIDRTAGRVADVRRRLGSRPQDVPVAAPERRRPDPSTLPVCNEPWGSLWIHQDGMVQFCLASSVIGDVGRATIGEIYDGDRAREIRRQFLAGDYSACHPDRCPHGGLDQFGTNTGSLPRDGRSELGRLSGLPMFRSTASRERSIRSEIRRVDRASRSPWPVRIGRRVRAKLAAARRRFATRRT